MIAHYTYWGNYFGYKFSIPIEIIKSLPQWQRDEAFPPLSPRVAIENSKLLIKQMLVEMEPFDPQFSQCALTAPTIEDEGDWWYYTVSWFVPDLEDITADWGEISVPVLLDGSTPEPIKFSYADRFDY